MGAPVAYNVWPSTASESKVTTEDDLDGMRGLLYSVAISLVFVWVPVGLICFGPALLTASSQ